VVFWAVTASAIHVEGLGKRYRVGERERYLALRDVLARAFKSPFTRGTEKRSVDYIWALKDLSLDVRSGEVVGLIGRNGAGKTTLLKLLSRITRPTTGFAEIRGRVGSLLEVGTGFHPELTGRENVYLSAAILGMKRREIDRNMDAIVDFAEIERFLNTPLKFYSTGMQMRLAFAVAAHLEPEILLVDEVLAVGDLAFQKKCLGKMEDVSRTGRTIVFVSHQMGQMRRLCERVYWIDAGRLREEGPAGDVIAKYESASMQSAGAPGDGRQRFLGWFLGNRTNIVTDADRELTFHFKLFLKEAVSRGHFGMTIFNDVNSVVVGWGFDDIEIASGHQEVVLTIPGLPIKPGSYAVSASLYDRGNNLTGGVLIEQWSAQPPLIVNTKPVGHPQERWTGLLNIPGRFHAS
jgi:ABC-type polysaccharide/polyol phosphate transport system ATPase subunit